MPLAQQIDGNFVVTVIQQLVLALGLALAGANLLALIASQRRRKTYEAELAKFKETRKLKDKSKREPKPDEPKLVRPRAAVVNIVIGCAIAVVAIASLTLGWVN